MKCLLCLNNTKSNSIYMLKKTHQLGVVCFKCKISGKLKLNDCKKQS